MSGLPNFPRALGNKGKGSGEWKFHGLVATWGSTMALPKEALLILKTLDHWKTHSWVCGLPPYINANMVDIRSFFCNLKKQNYLVFVVSQNQINLTNRIIFDVSKKFESHIYHLHPNSILWIQPIISNNFINIANVKNKDHKHLAISIE